tara:strand:- start:1123 stop:1920 length:798 start_codon:yes stop_codon:yes gene_type:complete
MVNINTVYQTVLYILNKEQRGYISPSEFNSLSKLVQDEIFQSYFPDGNQLNRLNQNNTQNDTEFFNVYENNRYKLYPFEHEVSFNYNTTYNCWGFNPTGVSDYSGTIRLLGSILSTYNSNVTNTTPQAKINPSTTSITQLASKSDFNKIIRSKLTAPTQQFPLAYQYSLTANNQPSSVVLSISPNPDSLIVNCIFEPTTPRWNSTVGSLGQLLFSQNSNNFQLDISEESNIIIGILKYAGVIINDPTIIDVAAREAQQVEVNEKS